LVIKYLTKKSTRMKSEVELKTLMRFLSKIIKAMPLPSIYQKTATMNQLLVLVLEIINLDD